MRDTVFAPLLPSVDMQLFMDRSRANENWANESLIGMLLRGPAFRRNAAGVEEATHDANPVRWAIRMTSPSFRSLQTRVSVDGPEILPTKSLLTPTTRSKTTSLGQIKRQLGHRTHNQRCLRWQEGGTGCLCSEPAQAPSEAHSKRAARNMEAAAMAQ